MPTVTLIRLGGLAAILAGALRIGSSFIPYSAAQPSVALEVLYLVIDVLILLGLLGIYGYQHEVVGRWGFLGFLLALIGTAIIVGPDGKIGFIDMYIVGALMISLGLSTLAIGTWNAKRLPQIVPLLWLTSTVVGVGGYLLGGPTATGVIAGLAFGLAFMIAGVKIWTDSALRVTAQK
jgi:hypothetical protein